MQTKNARETNPYSLPSVVLGPVVDDIEEDKSKEPCMVRVRHQNSALMHVDNESYDLVSTAQNPAVFNLRVDGGVLSQKTKRLRVSKLRLLYNVPNINTRNNRLVFANSAFPTVNYTVNIPVDFYTVASARVALLATLNSVTGSSGLTFSLTDVFAGSTAYVTLSVAGGQAIFRSSSFWDRSFFWGIPMYRPENSPYIDVPLSSIQFGPITARYTDYVDFVCREAYQFSKINTTGTQSYGDVLGRIYLDGTGTGQPISQEVPESWINYDKDSSITSMTITLLDMFEQPLYVPIDNCPMYFNVELVKQL